MTSHQLPSENYSWLLGASEWICYQDSVFMSAAARLKGSPQPGIVQGWLGLPGFWVQCSLSVHEVMAPTSHKRCVIPVLRWKEEHRWLRVTLGYMSHCFSYHLLP